MEQQAPAAGYAGYASYKLPALTMAERFARTKGMGQASIAASVAMMGAVYLMRDDTTAKK